MSVFENFAGIFILLLSCGWPKQWNERFNYKAGVVFDLIWGLFFLRNCLNNKIESQTTDYKNLSSETMHWYKVNTRLSLGTDKAEFWITCTITYTEGYVRISLILCCRDLCNWGFFCWASTQIHHRVLFVNEELSCGTGTYRLPLY